MGAEIARLIGATATRWSSSSGKGDALAKELGGTGVAVSNQPPEKLKRLVESTEKWTHVDCGVTRSV